MKFTIETKKTKAEIIQILLKNTSEQKAIVFIKNYDEFFSGTISEDTFKIWRNIHYRNSFLPVIIGKIEEGDGICKVHIAMRMNFFCIVFCFIWFAGVLFGCLITPFGDVPMPYALIPYIMLVAAILIVFLPKKIEEKIAKEKLEELLCF